MAARLCRLRLTLLLAVFRGPFPRVLRTVVIGILGIVLALLLAWLPLVVVERTADRDALDTVLFALVLLCAGVVPFFANRHHLEPRQFGWVPARPTAVATGLLVSTVVSWPVLWIVLWWGTLSVLRPEWRVHWWALLLAGVFAVALAVCGARVASALSRLIVPLRSVGALRAIGALLIVAALPLGVFAGAQLLRSPTEAGLADAAAVLGWVPIGAPIVGLQAVVAGETGAAFAHFGVALAWIVALLAVWYPLVRVSLEHIERPSDQFAARRSMGWFDRFSARPAAAIGARSLTYWRRDPRYRVALAAAPLAAALVVLALWIAGVPAEYFALVPLPLILLLLGWSLHNDIATDSTAIWMHIASGTRGRDDRVGRLVPVLVVGLPLVLVGSSLTVTAIGDWRALPAVIGLNLAVLLVSGGVSSVWSALLPYPTTRPGEAPFAQPAVPGSGAGLAQTCSMLIAVLLSVPPVWIGVQAALDPAFAGTLGALLFGIAYGLAAMGIGVLLGGRIFDRAGPEYIALTQTFD